MALAAISGLHYLLPSSLSIGPDWVLVLLVGAWALPAALLHRAGYHRALHIAEHVVTGIVSADIGTSLVLLIRRLPSHQESPKVLLVAAGGLWVSNILLFASWYWRLDAGGPHRRASRHRHESGSFLFPQMTLPDPLRPPHWQPGFVDYLFLAFNTSTAFSPTDVPVLSRWAKLLMMLQAIISLGTVAILAARAVNIL
jgi:uncharacterized membrane protein